MADSASNNWWGSWLQTAKTKSLNAYEQVKKDLGEYTSTVQTDTVSVVNSTSITLKDTFQKENSKLKQGLTSFIGELSNVVSNKPDSTQDVDEDCDVTYDRTKVRLHAVQIDPSTYLDPPTGPVQHYDAWDETFNLDSRKGDISELLVSDADVRSLYTKMVPNEMSHGIFWRRYFYRLHQIQLEDARKLALMKWAQETRDDVYSWDDDDDDQFVDISAELRTGNSPSRIPTTTDNKAACDDRLSGSIQDTDNTEKVKNNTHTSLDSNTATIENSSTTQSKSSYDISDGLLLDNSQTDHSTGVNFNNYKIENTDKPENVPHQTVQNLPEIEDIHRTENLDVSTTSDITLVETLPTKTDLVTTSPEQTDSELEVIGEVMVSDPVEMRSKVRGDMVVVGGSSSSSPISDENTRNSKDVTSGSADDEWDDDLEVTEEDMKAAEEVAKQLTAAGITTEEDEDDWNWE